jgi:hypothetical protein
MSQDYGIEAHRDPTHPTLRRPARFLVVIEAAGTMVARLYTEAREPVGEFDAGTEEVALMAQGLVPSRVANAPEWDRALEGHSAAERSAAEVYTLDV